MGKEAERREYLKSRGLHVLDFPFHIKIELSQGCNRSCSFCAIRASHKTTELMERATFERFIEQIRAQRVKRVDFSMHGEPLLNPEVVSFVHLLREAKPETQISVISNTDVLLQKEQSLDKMFAMFDAGLNIFHASCYDMPTHVKLLDHVAERREQFSREDIRIAQWGSGSHIWTFRGARSRTLVIVNDTKIEESRPGTIREIHTWAGNMPLQYWRRHGFSVDQFPVLKKCTEPFNTLAVNSRGQILICCVDWTNSFVVGDIWSSDLHSVWNGEIMQKIRLALHHGRRDLIPTCYFCNKRSYRVGLYPYVGPSWSERELRETFDKMSRPGPFVQNLRRLKGLEVIENEEISRPE